MTPCDNTVIEITHAQFAEFPAGCDPDFDADSGELERRFAELRQTLDHN